MKRLSKSETKRRRTNIVLGLLMIFLMVGSIVAFAIIDNFDGGSNTFEHNGFRFEQIIVFDDVLFLSDIVRYSTTINGEEVLFFFPPSLTAQVNVSSSNIDYLSNSSVVLFSRPSVEIDAEFDEDLLFFDYVVSEFFKFSFKQVRYGVLSESIFDSDLPVITCNDASKDVFVFFFSKNGSVPSINEVSPYCFEVSGSRDNLLYVSDFLLYKVHRVI